MSCYLGRSTIFFLILGLPFLAPGQSILKGKVVSHTTKEAIPFATIGLIKENIGTNADGIGNFVLQSKLSKQDDTLIFSSVGYRTLRLPVNADPSTLISVELMKEEVVLQEVTVDHKYAWTFAKLNDFSCSNNSITSTGFQTQLAQHFKVSVENSILKEIKICKRNDAPGSVFRVRIYDMDTLTKAPGNDLYNQVIEVREKGKRVTLHLQEFNILIPRKDFFIAVEWLRIPENEVRHKTKDVGGANIETITYSPSIRMSDDMDPSTEAWWQDFKGNWRRIVLRNNITSTSIAATVMY